MNEEGKTMRRFCTVFFTVIMVFLFCFISVYAEEPPTPELHVLASYDAVNEQICVTISIANNPGLTRLKGNLSYDDTLRLIKAEDAGVFGKNSLFEVSENGLKKNPYTLMWFDMNAVSNSTDIKTNGVLATLTFDILDKSADTYSFVFTQDLVNSKNANSEVVTFSVQSCTTTIPQYIYAVEYDANGQMTSIGTFDKSKNYSDEIVFYGLSGTFTPTCVLFCRSGEESVECDFK